MFKKCSRCKGTEFRLSKTRGMEGLVKLLGMNYYRCYFCGQRCIGMQDFSGRNEQPTESSMGG